MPTDPSDDPHDDRLPTARRTSGRPTKLVAWWAALAVAGAGAFVLLRPDDQPIPIASPPVQESKLSSTPAGGEGSAPPVPPPPGADASTVPTTTAPGGAAGVTTSTVAPGDLPEDRSTDGGPADWVSEDGCDPGYLGACIPKPPTPFSCDQITETNIRVVGNDAQQLDPDGDGLACVNIDNRPNPDRTPEEMAEFEKVD